MRHDQVETFPRIQEAADHPYKYVRLVTVVIATLIIDCLLDTHAEHAKFSSDFLESRRDAVET